MFDPPEPPEPEWDEEPCPAQASKSITVTLEPFVLNDLNAAIVNAVQLQCKQQIEQTVAKSLKQIIDEAVSLALTMQAENIIREAIVRPVQRTTEWGEPVGEPTSLRARLEEELRSHFYEKVDDSGKAERSEWNRSRCKTRLDWMVKNYALVEVEKEATKIVKEIGEEAKVKVNEALAALITEKLAPRIRTS